MLLCYGLFEMFNCRFLFVLLDNDFVCFCYFGLFWCWYFGGAWLRCLLGNFV